MYSSHADGIGPVCSAGGTWALLTPISVKGTIVRAKAKALLKTRTQKWPIVNATSHSSVSFLISLICLLQEERAMIEIYLSITAEK